MKKLIVTLICLIMFVNISMGQKTKVQSAYNYLKNSQLDKAQANIDEAIAHEQTMGMAKTWYYRGNVYLAIAVTDDAKYKSLHAEPLSVALESYKKAKELDATKEFLAEINERITIIKDKYYNAGVENYNNKKYIDAAKNFDAAKKLSLEIGRLDTLAAYNTALCAEFGKDSAQAISNYEYLIGINFRQPIIYSQLAGLYKSYSSIKDTVKALDIVQKGRKLFPDDYNLLIAETNIFLSTGRTKEANENLQKALDKDPNNHMLYFAIGANNDAIGNYAEAEKNYLKAIELKKDYFDAVYNLGALYFNAGVKLFEEADKLPPTEVRKYDELKEKFTAEWMKAIPQLERALEISPNDINTLHSLKQLYSRLQMYDKLKGVNDKLIELQK